MKATLLLLTFCLLCRCTCFAQIERLLPNKYWQYHHSHYDKNKNTVYTFNAIKLDSLKEVALYFEPNGKFKEIVNKNHPKPARTGTWQVKGQTLVLHFPNKIWNYNILFMDNKQFQCTMNK